MSGAGEKPQLLLKHHLKQLKLPTFLAEYEKQARECAQAAIDHAGYLLRLAELELIERERRMVERRIRAAKFPAVKSLDSFELTAIPSLNRMLVLELAAGCSVPFTTAPALVNKLMEARDERRLLRLQKQLAACKLLIIDELGYVPFSQTGAELLFETFSQRYERGSTVVTSNLPFEDWTSIFGSERLTGALLDRLTPHVHLREMNGDSYRLKQSKGRRRKAAPAGEAIDPETGEVIS